MTKEERMQIAESHFDEVTVKSWTYSRLTKDEKERCLLALFSHPFYGNTVYQIASEYESRYLAFLLGLDYKPIGWRDPAAAPKF